MNRELSPLTWIGIGVASAGLVTGKQSILLFGIGLAVAGYVGKERIVGALPPGIQRQIDAGLAVAPPAVMFPEDVLYGPSLAAI